MWSGDSIDDATLEIRRHTAKIKLIKTKQEINNLFPFLEKNNKINSQVH
jgi:hypothetical protein